MKIRNRLALIFTSSAAFILSLVAISVYFLSESSRQDDFFIRLNERVGITEQLFLEKENVNAELYEEIREKFLHTLPNEIEIVDNTAYLLFNPQVKEKLPLSFTSELLRKGYAEYHQGDTQGIGRIYTIENQNYAVIVTAEDQFGIAHIKHLKWLLITGLVVSVLFIFLTGRLFAKQALKPIALKIQKAQRIGGKNLRERLTIYNEEDELGQLAIAFNDMLDRLQEAFITQKNFIRNASHEIKNPLTTIIGESEVMLEKQRDADEYTQAIRSMNKEAHRLNDLVDNFLELAKTESSDYQESFVEVRLDELIIEVKSTLDDRYPSNQVHIDFGALPQNQDLLTIKANPDLIKIIVFNLLENACKFSQNKEVTLALQASSEGLSLQIKDQGIGMDLNDQQNIFQPLYRADNARAFKGTGLGLAIVNRIAQLHDIRIEINSMLNKGTSFFLLFPRTEL